MSLWAMRVAVPGGGPWHLANSEGAMLRLRNSPRRRQPARIPTSMQSLF